jgi:hypothetical protein
MPTAVDHVEAALERLTLQDIHELPPVRRRHLQTTLGAWACLCGDTTKIEKVLKCTEAAGVVAQLNNGERAP